MKFYNRYPGDLMKKTAGLSMAQMGAYDRFIDWCYANESGMEADEVYRIAHADSDQDRADVDKVLRKFFECGEDGLYRQQRVEEEIAAALPRILAARENGKKGGRPPSTEKPTGLPPGTQQGADKQPSGKANQEPEIKKNPPTPRKRGKATEAQALRFEEFWLSWPKNERKQDRAKCWEHWRRNALDAIADAILTDVRTKRGTQKWREGFVEAPLVYLRGKRWEDGVTPDEPRPEAGQAAAPAQGNAAPDAGATQALLRAQAAVPLADPATVRKARDRFAGKVTA